MGFPQRRAQGPRADERPGGEPHARFGCKAAQDPESGAQDLREHLKGLLGQP